MKNYLFTFMFIFALFGSAFGQTNLVDFETVNDPWVEPFDLTSYENGVANPNTTGNNTSDFVGKAVKTMTPGDPWGYAFWGGINIYFGGDVDLSASGSVFTIDFYTEDPGVNDTILFKFQLFNRDGSAETVEVDAYYTDANDTEVGVWKTLEFAIPDTVSGNYNKMVIFFGWNYSNNGDTYYYDNVTAPGFTAYGDTDVTFNITDKFNNTDNIQLFIDGTETTLTQTDNVYSATETLAPYNVTVGQDQGMYEVVYSYEAFGESISDTTNLVVGTTSGTQEVNKLIISEEEEDGTALAIDVDGTAPVIDGEIDAVWDNAKMHGLQQRGWFSPDNTPLYSYFKVMWDISNVYILNYVEDATFHNGQSDPWTNDNIEIFFDMDQSASEPFDGNDWQIRCIRGLDTWTGSANVDDTWAADVERAQAEMTDSVGYIVEWAIPWTSLSSSFLPLAESEFNFDVIVADNANGTGRDNVISWNTTADANYYSTEFYGTVTLSDMTDETAISDVAPVPGLSLYPNPVADQLYIHAGNPIKEVVVYDVVGRQTNNINNLNSKTVTLNVRDLGSNAIYIVKIVDNQGNVSSKKITVK